MQNSVSVERGRPTFIPFLNQKVVDGFKQEKLLSNPELLDDFVPKMNETREDQQILESWKHHYKNLGIPFVITEMESPNKKFKRLLSLWIKK